MVETAHKTERMTASQSVSDALLETVRLRAQLRLHWMQSSAGKSSMIEDHVESATEEDAFYESDSSAVVLCERIYEADLSLSQMPEWEALCVTFSLSPFEMHLLALCVASGADPHLARVYAYLHDDPGGAHATPWLAACLFQTPVTPLTPQSPLFRWRLATPAGGSLPPWTVSSPWSADPYVLQWLLGSPIADPNLASTGVSFIGRNDGASALSLYPAVQCDIERFIRSVQNSSLERANEYHPVEVELVGPTGSGKCTLAAQCAASLDFDLITADVDLLLHRAGSVSAEETAIRVIRMALLTQSAVYWAHSELLKQDVLESVPRNPDLVFFGTEDASRVLRRSQVPHMAYVLPALDRDTRSALWRKITPHPVLPVIEQLLLTPAEIAAAAHVACAGPEAVIAACSESLRGIARDLFVRLPCPFTWDDIVLPSHTRDHLRELEQQVELRWQVYEDWGFQRLCPVGLGITAMFSGPSGTGKTMAAQVLARSLDLQLYRVDLSGVMSKYIGETEKKLKQVFDACERSNVLLFFDEADALFGQRTRVEHAHDRFANIEIDYLLQRMEQFDGIAVLATNRRNDLDKAFLRRIRFIVEFPSPGPSERRALWKRALPDVSPRGEELLEPINWDLLADKLEMTGAEITAAALNAAFLAKADSGRITMTHVLRAARRELGKQGVMLRAADWEG